MCLKKLLMSMSLISTLQISMFGVRCCFMRKLIVAALVLSLSTSLVQAQSFTWTIVNWKVRHDFPNVKRITPKGVADWRNDPKRTQPMLLDVRTKAEFDVSHIPGSQRVDPTADATVISLPRDQPVVTYCSVGYRSGAFAQKLQKAGYKNVQNMSGSIFQWANEGRPMESNGKRAATVHPYNARWGKLVRPELRAKVPPAGAGL